MAQVGVLAGTWHEPQDAARAVGAGVQLRAQAAAAAAEASASASLRAAPDAARHAPAQTLRVSQSMSCCPAAPARPRAGRSASNTSSHQPRTDQRRKRRWTLGQWPRSSGRPTARPRRSAATPPRRASQRQSLRDFASTRDLLHRQHQRRPQGAVQAGPGHGRATPEASNTPRVARPETRSARTSPNRQFSHRPWRPKACFVKAVPEGYGSNYVWSDIYRRRGPARD